MFMETTPEITQLPARLGRLLPSALAHFGAPARPSVPLAGGFFVGTTPLFPWPRLPLEGDMETVKIFDTTLRDGEQSP
jgi:hypothetical protein